MSTKTYLNIRIEGELKKQIRARAKANHRTMVGEVLYLVTVGLLADKGDMTRERLNGGACRQGESA